ncbi:MAG: cache domain-containing protein [Candidatus Aminicenantes bacterium]|nr:cache domain-containing protein [Candidatus Aminicenantes bacterium]
MKKVFTTVLACLFPAAVAGVSAFAQAEKPKSCATRDLVIKSEVETAKLGGGYVEYLFTKLGQSVPQAKRSYVQRFEPFGWVVGTGYYLD